ncbi:MAG: nitroreductase family protein [Candidatus Hodarchaeota archaeon]
MDFYKVIKVRRTVRDFEERPVGLPTLKKILAAGLKAPTNDHLRRWEFIIVDDLETKKSLVGEKGENILKQPNAEEVINNWGLTDPKQREMVLYAIPRQAKMLLSAGALVIPCFYQPKALLEPQNLSSLNKFASIWLCIENILLAAAVEGIFGVTRIPRATKPLKIILGVPEDYEIPCLMALGYPKAGVKLPSQYEFKIEDKIMFNKWDKK